MVQQPPQIGPDASGGTCFATSSCKWPLTQLMPKQNKQTARSMNGLPDDPTCQESFAASRSKSLPRSHLSAPQNTLVGAATMSQAGSTRIVATSAGRRTKKCNINSNVSAVSVLESKHFQRQTSRMTRVCDSVLAITGKLLHAFRAAEYDVW